MVDQKSEVPADKMLADKMQKKHFRSLLLLLLNSLADFDGQICEDVVPALNELRQRTDILPPLYADVFGLPTSANCVDLVNRLETLSQQQIAVASYAFQIFRNYEHLLKADSTAMAPKQRSVYEAQLERMRGLVARTRSLVTETIGPAGRD